MKRNFYKVPVADKLYIGYIGRDQFTNKQEVGMLIVAKIHFNKESDYTDERGKFFNVQYYRDEPSKEYVSFVYDGRSFCLHEEKETVKIFNQISRDDKMPIFFNDKANAEKLGEFLSSKFNCYVEVWYGAMQLMGIESGWEVSTKRYSETNGWVYYENGTLCAKKA